MANIFHLNRETGEVSPCKARKKACPLGGAESHFGTQVEARKSYEAFMERKTMPQAVTKGGPRDHGLRDVVEGRPGVWQRNGNRTYFWADDTGMRDDPATLPTSFTSEEWKSLPRPALTDETFMGLEAAQDSFLKIYNMEERQAEFGLPPLFGGKVEANWAHEFVSRALAGEKTSWDEETYKRNFAHMPPKEAAYRHLTGEGEAQVQTMEAALLFPERDLYPVLKRMGVRDVAITSFDNLREQGLVYTVVTPTGDTRSFNIYEHRNTDAIVINGRTNWNREEKPYGPYPDTPQGSKWDFFAEFSPDTPRRQIAETLGFFLQSAQRGDLPDDATLVSQVERIDRSEMLRRLIPGFGEWYDKTFGEKSTPNDPRILGI